MKPLVFRIRSIVAVIALAVATPAFAQKAIVLVRHAEKVDESADPLLSAAGMARAENLAKALRSLDVKAIYTTQYQRTTLTSAPLARRLGIESIVVPANQAPVLVERMRKEHPNDVVLTVGHSNSVPNLLKLLGVPEEIKIADDEFDNLFVVVPQASGPPLLLRLRF